MKISLRPHLLALLLFTASGAVRLQGEAEPAPDEPRNVAPSASSQKTRSGAAAVDPIVGKWAWHDYVTITFQADGTGAVSNGDEVTWQTTHTQPGAHTYEVTWPHRGFHDELIFNDGAQTGLLIGDKQENYTARRIPDPIVGKWDWHHHETVTFKMDGTCESTDGMHGTWQFTGGPDTERNYAIDFGDGRYKDELTFNKDGKTALLVGSYRENYTVSKASE